MTTISDHALKIVNAQYTKTAVENVLTDLKELYETSLVVKAEMSANAVSHYAGPLSAPFDIESPSTAIVEPKSLITIGGLAKLHKAINSLHLVVDQQNKIINPDQEPVSPVEELRRQVAEAAKGGAAGSVTQTTSRYKLITPPTLATDPENVNPDTKEVFETEVPGLKKIYDEAVARGTMVLSFEDWLIFIRGRTESEFKHDEQKKEAKKVAERGLLQNMDADEQEAHRTEIRKQEAVYGCISEDTSTTAATPSEPSGALPKVVAIHDGPAPPKNSLAVLVSHESPLCEIFSPSPWFHQGRGTITVGSKDFSYYKDVDPTKKDGKTRATLPNAFYGGDGQPKWVLIRLKTCALLWNFEFDVESMSVYMAGVSDAKTSEEPRWFKASELSASFSARLLLELNQFKEEIQ